MKGKYVLTIVVGCMLMLNAGNAKAAEKCSADYHELEDSLYTVLSASPLKSAPTATTAFLDLMKVCHQTAVAGTEDERKVYDDLLKTLSLSVDVAITKIMISSPTITTDKAAMADVETLKGLRQDLAREAKSVKVTAAKLKECSTNYKELEASVYSLVSTSPIRSAATTTFHEALKACHQTAVNGSVDDRKIYLDVLQTLTTSVDGVVTVLTPLVLSSTTETARQNGLTDIQILRTVRLDLSREALLVGKKSEAGWNKDYDLSFYLGNEATTVSGMASKSTRRVGVSVYSQLWGALKEDSQYKSKWYPNRNLIVSGDVMLASAVSSSVTGTTSSITGSAGDGEVSPAFGVAVNAFVPLFTRNQSFGLLAFGPIVSFEFDKPDDAHQFTKSFANGVRLANDPHTYFDVMFGRVQGISGGRLSLRGQYALGDLLGGKVLVGGAANMTRRITDPNPPEEREWLKMYVMWQVGLSDLFPGK